MEKLKKIVILLLIVIIILVVALISVITNNLLSKNDVNNQDENIKNEISENTNGENEEFQGMENESRNVAILGMRNLTIEANKKDVSVNFQNPIENKGLYYQTFELRLLNNSEEGYEVLYKSDMVKPGEKISEIELPKALEKGEYEAILHIQPYCMDEEKTPTNDAKIKIKVIAQ